MTKRLSPDASLLVIAGLLSAIGAVMVYSASSVSAYDRYHDAAYFLKRELVWIVVGAAAMWFGATLDYCRLRRLAPWTLGLAIVMLGAVLVPHIGTVEGGARRWFTLGPVSFEPSEFAKLALVIYLARLLSDRENAGLSFSSFEFPALFWMGLCFALVLLEPDLGTASLFVMTAFVMLFVGGVKPLRLLALAALCVPLFVGFIFSSSYRRDRFTSFLHPWRDPRGAGYHIIQSLYALGSGGWFGLGLGQSRQKFGYLPEQYTDFIYAIVGEELGFVGATTVLALFISLAYRGLRIAMQAQDRFGFFLAIGLTTSLVSQALVNIGVVTSSWPVTGVPLPFVSYGGTSLVLSLFGVGLIASVSRGRSRAAHAAETPIKGGFGIEDSIHGRRHGRAPISGPIVSASAARRSR
ncbi:MAG: putative lipid II flippase FtsW [Candidatus Eremiobacteraeota bacterium]|nr:putative lipid II flippase FtsW [Candidatus Eremiobacteraeota bacterium]